MILVVDDEEFVVILAKTILTCSGFEVIGVRTAQAALDAIKRWAGRISVVLLDVHMPGRSGLSLVPSLREAHPDLRIVLTSGYLAEDGFAHLGPRISFLQKPYSCDGLTAAVEAALIAA